MGKRGGEAWIANGSAMQARPGAHADEPAAGIRADVVKALVVASALSLPAGLAAAAEGAFPARPIRLIVAQAPGSGPDILARLIGQKLTESWGQQVIVENRPGANGIIGVEAAAKAKPDGYTIFIAVPSALTMNPYVYKSLPYDTFRDFTPITQTATNTFGLFVNVALPARSVKELVALARSRPKELPYASYGVGNQTHLAAELFAGEGERVLAKVGRRLGRAHLSGSRRACRL